MGWQGRASCKDCWYIGYMYGQCPNCGSKNVGAPSLWELFIFPILCLIILAMAFVF